MSGSVFSESSNDYVFYSIGGVEDELCCSFIYSLNLEEGKKELWRDIKDHHNSPLIKPKLWLVFGEFNEIRNMDEHSVYAKSTINSSGRRNFHEVVHYCSLIDMSYQGPKVTWCNKQDQGLIFKKLDRTMINDARVCSGYARVRFWICQSVF